MPNIIKNFITSAAISLSRINDLKGRDSFVVDDEDDTHQEQQVRKQEINIISEKRFYDLLNKADEYHKNKYSLRTQSILESRGINEDFLSFNNFTYEPPLHEQMAGNTSPIEYKFKTDNDICKYASSVHIKEYDNKTTLNFLINVQEHPRIKTMAEELRNLTAFAINHNGKIFAYEVIKFEGIISPNPHEIFLVFESKCVMNGEYGRELSNESRTMYKDDLIDPKTFKL